MKRFFISTAIVVVGSLITLAGLHFFWPKWSPVESYLLSRFSLPTVSVVSAPLTESLRVTDAQLVARESFELSFPYNGTIEALFVSEGQLIYDPIPLIKLDTTLQSFEVAKAEAVLRQNQANVNKLKTGTREEILTVSNDETKAAKETLKQSKKKLVDAIRAAYSDTDDSIRTKTDPLFVDPRGDNPETDFTASDSSLEDDIESGRRSIEQKLDDWREEVHGLNTTSNLTKANTHAAENLNEAQEFLDDLSEAVSALSAGGALTQDTLDTWKEAVTAARSSVNTARSTLSTAFSTYRTAGHDVTVAESTYNLKESGSMSQDIDIARFQLEEAQNALSAAEQKLAEGTLDTPHSHLIVKKIFPKIGEHVTLGEPIIILDTPELKIQLDIPEEDMGHVAIGNQVTLTLDAFPDTPVVGIIENIEPLEITKNENILFRVFARPTDQSATWRSGMSGTAQVVTGQAATTLQVPRSAVYRKHDQRMVQVLGWNETPEERPVVVGIQNEKMIEIKSGLTEHQEVVLYPSPLK